MNQSVRVIIGIVIISSLVFGFVQLKESRKEEKKSSSELIADALLREGIPAEIYITNGSEAAKEFNVTAKPESRIAFVMFRIPGNWSSEDVPEGYVKAVHASFSADATIDAVLVMNINYAEFLNQAIVVYVNRSLAEETKNRNLKPQQAIREWNVINYVPQISPAESREMVVNALKKTGMHIDTVQISNGTYMKDALHLQDEQIKNDSRVVLVMFYIEGNTSLKEFHKYFVDIIYAVFNADPSIDVVMAYDMGLARASKRAWVVYTDRNTAKYIWSRYETIEERFQLLQKHMYNITM